jgi:hypothetical protein
MSLSKNLNTYLDVVQVLTAAREAGGVVTYELKSSGKAVMWRMRAYYYRTLLARTAAIRAGNVRGFVPTTAWDDMLLEQEGNKVYISFGRVSGKITSEDGKEIEPAPPPSDIAAAETILREVPAPLAPREPHALDETGAEAGGGSQEDFEGWPDMG